MVIFMAASMLAGQAQSIEWLIFWRGVQGLGAGAMMPVAMTMAAEAFSGPDRGKIQGILSGGFGISSLVGPTLGGWITDGPGWRWAFYINIPLGLIVLAILFLIKLPAFQKNADIHIDYLGAMGLMVFTTTLLLGFVFGGDETIGWTRPQTLAMFGIAALSLIGFILAEQRAADPIIPLSLFKNPIFVVVNVSGFLTGMAMFGAINYISLFIQGVQGESATHSGTAITPMMIALVVGTIIGGQGVGRLGKYRLLAIVSMLIMTLGVLQLVFLDVHSGTFQVLAGMITLGFGIGISFPVFIIALQNAFEMSMLGTLNSLVGFFRQIGGTVGISIQGSILTATLATELTERMKANLPEPAVNALNAAGFKPNVQMLTSTEGLTGMKNAFNNDALFNGVVLSLREALANSLHLLFIGSLVIAVLAFLSAFFLKQIPLKAQFRGKAVQMSEHAGSEEEPELVEVAS
jgi:EmrB/QacA subfamily drug resistance transporter